MNANRETLALLQLLRAALWDCDICAHHCFPLSQAEWQGVYGMAKEQAIVPLITSGIDKLPSGMLPPDEWICRAAAEADATERQHERHNAVVARLCAMFEDKGVKAVVLKGQAVALLHRRPLLRTVGDIDLYFPVAGDFGRANDIIRSMSITMKKSADGSLHYVVQGIVVEHHQHFLNVANRMGHDFLCQLESNACFDTVVIGGKRIMTPAPMENLLLLNTHILSHAIGWGVGLRQLCDMACAYRAYRGRYDGDKLADACRRAGIYRWTLLLHSFLVDVLGMPVECLPFQSDRVDSTPLFRLVMRSGNFGYALPRRNGRSGLFGKISTARAFVANPMAWRYAPLENICKVVNLVRNQK